MKNFLFILWSFLLFSCYNDEKVTPHIIWPQSIKQVAVSGKTVSITVICQIPTPCYDYYKYSETRDENHFFITFYAKHDNQTVCPQVLSSLEAQYIKTVLRDGEYTFHFFRDDSTSLDTLVFIR